MIRDAERTPFNIGKRIDLADFEFNEAHRFVQGLGDGEGIAERLLKRVLYWTNGHPYLTQKLCVLVQGGTATDESPEVRVDRVVTAQFLGLGRKTKEDNLKAAIADPLRAQVVRVGENGRTGPTGGDL